MARVTLDIEREETGGHRVVVEHDGDQYASTSAPTIDCALRMAVPYIASVVEPDPLGSLTAWRAYGGSA